jgi:hypothetical protein
VVSCLSEKHILLRLFGLKNTCFLLVSSTTLPLCSLKKEHTWCLYVGNACSKCTNLNKPAQNWLLLSKWKLLQVFKPAFKAPLKNTEAKE